ncbi:hypothetical protein LSAT2_003681 [Lamellibrachia satsuma]|nr:hypothetical protein LSAT2_003681 [Lamellibrachia satsuma]
MTFLPEHHKCTRFHLQGLTGDDLVRIGKSWTYVIKKEKHTQRRSWPKHWDSLVEEYHKLDRKFADKPLRPDEMPTPPAIRNTYSYYPWLSLDMDPIRCTQPGLKLPPPAPRAHSVPTAGPCQESLEQEPCERACHGRLAPRRAVCPGTTESPTGRDVVKRPASSHPAVCRVLMPDPPKPPEPEMPSPQTTPTPSPTWRSPPPEPPAHRRPSTAPLPRSPAMYGLKKRSLDLDRSQLSLIPFSEVANPGIVPSTAAAMIGWKSDHTLEVYRKCNEWARPHRELYKTFKWPIESLGYM